MRGCAMIVNTDITIYSRKYDSDRKCDTWEGPCITPAWWHTAEKSNVTTDGLKQANVTTIRIPDISVAVKKDDYIVRGQHLAEIKSVKDLDGYCFVKVTAANYNAYGGNPHIKVVTV